ncbi:MAG: hypothetical protein SV760_00505, partial [Halobacteria archaeon]|nr:hypothetical protein [Halobacteria archaeon]
MTGKRTTLIRQTLVPVSVFATVVLLGIAGFVYLADVGVVEATFWLIDPTSIELHFSEHSGPETATK